MAMLFPCPVCGEQMSTDADTCLDCGAKLAEAGAAYEAEVEEYRIQRENAEDLRSIGRAAVKLAKGAVIVGGIAAIFCALTKQK